MGDADSLIAKHREGARAFARRIATERGTDPDDAESVAELALVKAARSFDPDRMRPDDAWSWVSYKVRRAYDDLITRKHPEFGDTRKLNGEVVPTFSEFGEFADKPEFVDKLNRSVQNEVMDRVDLRGCAAAVPCSVWLVLSIVRHDWQAIEGVGRTATAGGRAEWWFAPDGIRNVRARATERLRSAAEKQKRVLELICERLRRMEARR